MNITNIETKFYNIKQAAIYLGISEKSVRRLLKRGVLQSSKALRKLLIPKEQLESFFETTK